jgi:hypothetical protein
MRINQQALEIREHVVAEMEAGNGFGWAPGADVAEMIGTGDVPTEFLETVQYNLEEGREQVPLIYKPIYDTTSQRDLPEVVVRKSPGSASVVFLRKYSGGEVVFGDLEAGEESLVRIYTWAAGLEFDEDFVEYNKLYDISRLARVFGTNYNKLLNHLHLAPFTTSAAFVTTGSSATSQKAAQVAGTPQLIPAQATLADTFRRALEVLPQGTIVLHNSADTYAIEDAIAGDYLSDDRTPSSTKRRLDAANFIVYDGTTIVVGGKTYTYAGVAPGEAYLIVPKQNYEELEKHDLITDTREGSFTRLILSQTIGRTRRGVFAAHGGDTGAVKIDLA